MMSGAFGVCVHIAGNWTKSPTNMTSLFWNVHVVKVFCLRCYSTAHNMLVVIIDISSMIMTSAFFNLVKTGFKRVAQINSHVLVYGR